MHKPSDAPPHFTLRWASVLLLGVVLVPVTFLQPYRSGPPIRSDGGGYHIWTYAFLKGDLSFAWYRGGSATPGLFQADPARPFLFCKYPPGVALLRLPLMALLVDPARGGPPYSEAEHWACLVYSAVVLVLVAALALRVCLRLGASLAAAHAAVLLLTFGTGLFHYATYYAAFSHVYSALGTALLMWLAVVAVQDRSGQLPAFRTVATLAFFVLVRNTNLVLIAFWVVAFLAGGWWSGVRRTGLWLRNAVVVALGVGLGVGVQLALNYNAFGHLQFSSYGGRETFDWGQAVFWPVLWSFERGLFTYYPVLGVVLLAGLLVRRTRLACAWLALLILTYTLLYGSWCMWYLGWGFGHRGFIDMVPFAIPLFAVALTEAGAKMSRCLGFAGVVGVYVTTAMMIGYWCGTFPKEHATARDYSNHLTLSFPRLTLWRFVPLMGQ
jgi:hypothetical protein